MNQSERVLELLKSRGPRGLTALEAMTAGCGMRLAARISDLRAAGHLITSETITTLNGARVARYSLDGHACPLCGGWYVNWDAHQFYNQQHLRAEEKTAASHKVAHEPENLDLMAGGNTMTTMQAVERPISVRYVNASQSWHYHETLKVERPTGHIDTFRITIRSNAYDEQSHGKVERWTNGEEWREVVSRHGPELVSRHGDMGDRRPVSYTAKTLSPLAMDAFRTDRDDMLTEALAVIR